MDYLIRCTVCNHSVTQHGPRGCDGESSMCSCRIDRDGVLSAIVLGDPARYVRPSGEVKEA